MNHHKAKTAKIILRFLIIIHHVLNSCRPYKVSHSEYLENMVLLRTCRGICHLFQTWHLLPCNYWRLL